MTQDNSGTNTIHTFKRSDPLHKWLVFTSSFVVTMFDVGLFYSQGPLFVIVMNRFNSTRAATAIIQSLLPAVLQGTGLFSGMLIHKYGTRKMGLVGGLIASVALLLSAFATSVTYLVITNGIMLGIGMSPCFIGPIAATGQHFEGEKGRSIVLSVLSAASGVGGMIYPYLILYLDNLYGLPGIYLICTGLILHSCAAALLWSSPSQQYPESENTTRLHVKAVHEQDETTLDHNNAPDLFSKHSSTIKVCDHKYPAALYDVHSQSDEHKYDTLACVKNCREDQMTPSGENEHELELINNLQDHDKSVSNNPVDFGIKASQFETESQQCSSDKNSSNIANAGLPQDTSKNKVNKTRPGTLESVKYLGKQRVFWAYAFGLAFAQPAINLIPVFVVDIVIDIGFTASDASLGLTLMNVFSTFGRLSVGFLMKIPCLPTHGVPMLASLCAALSMAGMAYVTSLEGILVLFCTYGYSLGLFIATFSVATTKLFGVEHLSNALGIVFSMGSIGNAVGGPVSGYIRDKTNSYTAVLFTSAGACIIGVALFLLSHIWYKALKTKDSETNITTVMSTRL